MQRRAKAEQRQSKSRHRQSHGSRQKPPWAMRRSWQRPSPCPWQRKNRGRSRWRHSLLWKLKLRLFPSRLQAADQNQHPLNQIVRQSKLRSMTTRMPTPMPTVLQSLLPTSLQIQILLPLLLRILAQPQTKQPLRPRRRQGLWDRTQPSERDLTLICCCKFNQHNWKRYIPLTDILCRSERAEAKGPDPSLCQGPMGLAKGPQARAGILAA